MAGQSEVRSNVGERSREIPVQYKTVGGVAVSSLPGCAVLAAQITIPANADWLPRLPYKQGSTVVQR